MSALLWFLSGLMVGMAIGGIFLLAFTRSVKRAVIKNGAGIREILKTK